MEKFAKRPSIARPRRPNLQRTSASVRAARAPFLPSINTDGPWDASSTLGQRWPSRGLREVSGKREVRDRLGGMRTCVRVAGDGRAEKAHYAREPRAPGGSREQRALRFMAQTLRQLERRALEKLPDHGMYPLAWEQDPRGPSRHSPTATRRCDSSTSPEVVDRPGDPWTRRMYGEEKSD
jgi:hypothetical protein